MKTPKRKLNRNELGMVRATAIRALRMAFPSITTTELARALSMDRSAVKYHLSNRFKTECAEPSPMEVQQLAASASMKLNRGALIEAADKFEALAQHLRGRAAA